MSMRMPTLKSPFDSLGGKSSFTIGGVKFEVMRQFSAFGGYDLLIIAQTSYGEKSFTIWWDDPIKKVGNPFKGKYMYEELVGPGEYKTRNKTAPSNIDEAAYWAINIISEEPGVKSYMLGRYSAMLNEYFTQARKDFKQYVKQERSGDPWQKRKRTTKSKSMATRKTTAKKTTTAKEPTLAQLKPKAKKYGIRITTKSGVPKKKAQLLKEVKAAESKAKAKRTRAANKKKADTDKVYPQTGRSISRYDRMRSAKAPGWRVSKSGRKYFENRKNRSDVPGTLEEKYNGWANYWTWKANLEVFDGGDRYYIESLTEGADYYDGPNILAGYFTELYLMEVGGSWIEGWMDAIAEEIDFHEIWENAMNY